MDKVKASKIAEWASYILIVGATVVFFVSGKEVSITLLMLVVAVYCRALMYRCRYRADEEEIETLQSDLHRLTLLLKQHEKSAPKSEN